jgi:excinuclease ABC subunit C
VVPNIYYINAPRSPGIYVFKNIKNEAIYVGKAKILKDRVSYYFQKGLTFGKTRLLVGEATKIEYIRTVSEVDALILEADLIKKLRPKYNEALKDDKNYSYIRIGNSGITKNGFPAVSLVRTVGGKDAFYFGPYPTGSSIAYVLKTFRKIYGFRDCSDSKFKRCAKLNRGCLFFDLKLCPGPCVKAISPAQYHYNLLALKLLLKSGSQKLERRLSRQMGQYSKALRYEEAFKVKTKLDLVSKLRQLKFSPLEYQENPNLANDQRNLELKELIKFIKLFSSGSGWFSSVPNTKGFNIRIEAYDISSSDGQKAVASMVVFSNGDASKEDYRKFKIKDINKSDDYKMLAQVLTRRFHHLEWPMPDLVVVDGGLGQVSAAIKSLPKNIPIIGLAKRLERPAIFGKYRYVKSNNPGLNLLKRIRDEAHRFANSYHKLIRSNYAIPA